MYNVHVHDAGDRQEDLKNYLTETLELESSKAQEIADGDETTVTTVESRDRAEQIADELAERGADATVEAQPEPHVVTGSVTFEGERPEATVHVEAVDVFTPNERELGGIELQSDGTYSIEYEAVPDRMIYLVVRAVLDEETLAESDAVSDAGTEETVDLTVPKRTEPVSATTQGTDLFDFMIVRPPDSSAIDMVPLDAVSGDTSLTSRLGEAQADGNREAMIEAAIDHMQSDEFVDSLDAASGALATLDRQLSRSSHLTEEMARTVVEDAFGASPSEVAASDEFQRASERLGDSLEALSVVPGGDRDARRDLSRGVRLIGLVRNLADGGVDDVGEFLERPVAMPDELFPLPNLSGPAETDSGSSSSDGESVSERARELHDELKRIQSAKEELLAVDRTTSGSRSQEGESGGVFDESVKENDDLERPSSGGEFVAPTLPQSALESLSSESLSVLEDVTSGASPPSVVDGVNRLTEKETEIGSQFLRTALGTESGRSVQIGDTYYPLSGESGGLGLGDETMPSPPGMDHVPDMIDETPPFDLGVDKWGDGTEFFDTPLVNVLGVGEMKTVKRETARYEMGDLAHVENVLDGEVKERVHEREEVTEETILTEQETTESQKRDLQTSEQFELERETEETVKEKSSIEAGVSVSASYGPTIQMDAYTDYSRSQSRERSTRAARRYSREVTKETVNRIKRRQLRREVRKRKQRVTETNTHSLSNTDDDGNLSGIYRWVDRIVKAQVFEHGRRLMLEFIVPEPAAFYRMAKSTDPADQVKVEKPEPPTHVERDDEDEEWKERPLEPEDIEPWNYKTYAQKYGAMEVSPPPSPVIRETTKIKQEGKGKGDPEKPVYKKAEDIKIEDGYKPVEATVTFSDIVRNDHNYRWKLQTLVGNEAASVGWRGTWDIAPPNPMSNKNPNPHFVRAVRKEVQQETDQNMNEGKIRNAVKDAINGLSGDESEGEIVDEVATEIEDQTFFPHDRRKLEEGVQDVIDSGVEPFGGSTFPSGEKTYENHLNMENKQKPVAFDTLDGAGSQTKSLTGIPEGKNGGLPVTAFGYNLLGFAVTVTVKCHRTQRRMEKWRIETYKKIKNAYEKKLEDYRTAVEEAETEGGVQIEGNAPEENRRIEREELKRLAISMMRREHLNIDAVKDAIGEDAESDIPGVDFDALRENNRVIQFFEQAFEWNDMTYLFYPYFWTDQKRWSMLEQIDANDPAFESFLSAGAARVVVPVNPGYFGKVLWFLQTQDLDFDPPDLGDERFVPIISEIKEKQGLDEDAEPDGDPWAVRTPTELVKLQQSQDLPDLPPDVDTEG